MSTLTIKGRAKCKSGFVVESLLKDFMVCIPTNRRVAFQQYLNEVIIVQKDFVWRTDIANFGVLFDVVEVEEN